MSVNSLPQIPDRPLLLGYFVVKGENRGPIKRKDPIKVRGLSSNLHLYENSKSIVLIFGPLSSEICVSICQILGPLPSSADDMIMCTLVSQGYDSLIFL